MKLSKNFSLHEFTKSSMASRLNISNNPNENQIGKLKTLAGKLQRLRDCYGKPISISSGFRSKELNKALDGAAESQHMLCMAVDLDNDASANIKLFEMIRSMGEFDQLINEFNYAWIHVSFSDEPRGEVLRAVKRNGKTVYEIIAD